MYLVLSNKTIRLFWCCSFNFCANSRNYNNLRFYIVCVCGGGGGGGGGGWEVAVGVGLLT